MRGGGRLRGRSVWREETMNLEKLGRLQDIMQEMTDRGFVSGVSCMVIQHGEEQCYCETGYRDIAAEHKMTRDTIHRLYSMTKPVTAAAVMILLEEGKIDLLDQVSDYLLGFRNQYVIEQGVIVPVKRPITIQNLLNMTSGLTYLGEGSPAEIRSEKLIEEIKEKLLTDQALTTVEVANRIGKLPLAFIPGTAWQYGLSADVLGAIVEVASGMRYGEFLKERIFEPLGMKDTAFYVPQDKQERLARVYRETAERLAVDTECHLGIQNRMQKPPAYESGGAGLCSTIDDYAAFAQMLLSHGTYRGRRILSPETVQYMTTAHITPAQRRGMETWESLNGYTYGNLMRILTAPEEAAGLGSKGEYGWDGRLGTYMMNDPAHELTMLIMQQKTDSGTSAYTRRMRNVLYAALED